jgi:hypothetical protein
MVRKPDATRQPTPHDIQLMSKHRVLSFKPQLRLEWRGQDRQNETQQPDHSSSIGDSITASTQIRFSVHTGESTHPVYLWWFAFNQLPDLPQQLLAGKSRLLIDWLFDSQLRNPAAISERRGVLAAGCDPRWKRLVSDVWTGNR